MSDKFLRRAEVRRSLELQAEAYFIVAEQELGIATGKCHEEAIN